MEFLAFADDDTVLLPKSFNQRCGHRKPSHIVVYVRENEYQFEIEDLEYQGDWGISGESWERFYHHHRLADDDLLHFVVTYDGPIYLILYNNRYVSSTWTYDQHVLESRPSAYAVTRRSTQKFLMINQAWFDLLACNIQQKHRVWAHGHEYTMDVKTLDEVPIGIEGQYWETLYQKLDLQRVEYVFIKHWYDEVFKLSFFTSDGVEVHSNVLTEWDLSTHDQIQYMEQEAAIGNEGASISNFGVFHLTQPHGTWFDRLVSEKILRKRSITIKPDFVSGLGCRSLKRPVLSQMKKNPPWS